ncbi:MAG: FAD/NAD(P)-binding protein, partial [Burkholderiaceae bacterium]
MKKSRIGIIGVGSRGLTLLERIVAQERQRPSGRIEILLFDPNAPGPGCHDPAQSELHLVNTVAGQLTVFADASVVDAGPVVEGPSFHQWLNQQND